MKSLLTITIFLLVVSCGRDPRGSTNGEKITDSISLYIPYRSNDLRMERDFEAYIYKGKLSDLLSLKPLENGVESFELRFWQVGALFDPIILYVLKKQYNGWLNLHYQLYRGESWTMENPQIDSASIEVVRPRIQSWEKYIASLNLDSLWMTPSQREVVGKTFGAVDGYSYYIELADNKRYRFLNYYVPDFLQDTEPNHRRIVNFQENLRTGIVYKGIINP